MASAQLTEYLFWKSMKHKTATSSVEEDILKEEPNNKQEIFDSDMLCRVCTNPAAIPITDKIDGISIITALRAVANISIIEGDNYPKYVCKICEGELKVAFQFKKKCESSDLLFRKLISSETALVTNSQPKPVEIHDDINKLMKQNRISQKLWIKNDESDELNSEEAPSPSLQCNNQTTSPIVEEISSHRKKRKKRSSSPCFDTNTNKGTKIENNCSNLQSYQSSAKVSIDNGKNKTWMKTRRKCVHKCKPCDLTFYTKEDFQKHRKEKSCVYHACPLCGKLVLNLVNHEQIIHSRTNKYTCHQCGKIYYSSAALANHMYKHVETKEYFCDHCPYRGKRKSYLVCHMRVHSGEHKYLCSSCPLKFRSLSNLNKHQRIHYKKKFECNKCKRLFHEERNLKSHFDAAHLNIRYRCTICGTDLMSRKKLLNHELRVHKREKHKLFDEVQRVVIGTDHC